MTARLAHSRTPPMTSQDRRRTTDRLYTRWPRAGEAERNDIVDRVVGINLPLARRLANRYAGRGIAHEDLEQVAFLGLVNAAQGYDPQRGYDFVSYAVPTIRGEIRRHFRDAGWVVRPPRRVQELQSQVWVADGELTQTLHRSPSAEEIAEHLGADPEQVAECLAADGCYSALSLDTPLGDEETQSLAESLGTHDPELARAETRHLVRQLCSGLADRDREILRLRFVDELSQSEIGDAIGVSQMQVSRLLTRILGDLRARVEGYVIA
ncbi:MAG: SigB/SigF/SigG family RNA polymerase sigma factor [Nocardioidaceae bacterium]